MIDLDGPDLPLVRVRRRARWCVRTPGRVCPVAKKEKRHVTLPRGARRFDSITKIIADARISSLPSELILLNKLMSILSSYIQDSD